MTIHCPTCNRSSDNTRFIGEFCEFCTADRLSAKISERISILRCGRCGSIKVKGRFVPFNTGSLGEALTSGIHLHGCTARVKGLRGNSAIAEISCGPQDSIVTFEKRIRIITRHEMCPTDYKISSGYYEALIQLRGDHERCERMAARITRFVQRRGAFISRTKPVQNGIDVYTSDKALMNQFFSLRRMRPKRSFRLQSLRNGRELYSNIYALRL